MAVLELFRATAHVPGDDLHILCDSQYVINSVTKWMPGWKRKGWRKADGKPVMNVELLKEIDEVIVDRSTASSGCAATSATTSTRRRMTAPGQRPRPTSRAWPSGRVPGSAPRRRAAAGRTPQDKRRRQATAARSRPQPAQPAAPCGRRPAARPQAAPAPAGQQELFGAPALFDEPDLFSELEEESRAGTGAEPSPEAVVESLERELLRPETRADLGRTGVLLHPDFTEIGSSGRIWTRDAHDDGPGGQPGRYPPSWSCWAQTGWASRPSS